MGVGVGVSRTNPHLFTQPTEVILQAYYQAHVVSAIFLQPTASYIPTLGRGHRTRHADDDAAADRTLLGNNL